MAKKRSRSLFLPKNESSFIDSRYCTPTNKKRKKAMSLISIISFCYCASLLFCVCTDSTNAFSKTSSLLFLSSSSPSPSPSSPSSPSSSLSMSSTSGSMSNNNNNHNDRNKKRPIVYTIAGSDSGGGAGIQADLLTIHDMDCHGCSAITCLTAQNSMGVTGVHFPPTSFFKTQLEALLVDLPPRAVKIGMLGSQVDLVRHVGETLQQLNAGNKKVWIVLDPVMISTSGSKLITDDAKDAMINHVFPHVDVLTPNKFEAEELLQRKLNSFEDVEQAARDLLNMGVSSVLIKGGHTDSDVQYAQDYFLSKEDPSNNNDTDNDDERRLCDGSRGVWLRSVRYDTIHTHGTGCTLSSAIASSLALGEASRDDDDDGNGGATKAMDIIDACCLAKAYVTAGIDVGGSLGKGPGPVRHTGFPSTAQHFPSIVSNQYITQNNNDGSVVQPFRPMKSFSQQEEADSSIPTLGRIIPIVDSVEWVEALIKTPGITDIQLRIKKTKTTTEKELYETCLRCKELCSKANVRLWINDYWEIALQISGDNCCFGVHIGQEDLVRCIENGGLRKLKERNIALGISTHSYGELSVALGLKPSYISLGPIFATSSKVVKFQPQGLGVLSKWRHLIPQHIPLVVIGSISNAAVATRVRHAGADCSAVIGAITSNDRNDHERLAKVVRELNEAMMAQ